MFAQPQTIGLWSYTVTAERWSTSPTCRKGGWKNHRVATTDASNCTSIIRPESFRNSIRGLVGRRECRVLKHYYDLPLYSQDVTVRFNCS
jgi:hypothetical protein